MLAHVVGECWHALVRDIIALGYRPTDIFTTLGVAEMVSIVAASPPGSAVRYALDGGWSKEAQLMANMQEQAAGIATLGQPYARPGVAQRPDPTPGGGRFFPAEAMTWEEADRRDKLRYSGQLKPKGGPNKRTRTRVYGPTGAKT